MIYESLGADALVRPHLRLVVINVINKTNRSRVTIHERLKGPNQQTDHDEADDGDAPEEQDLDTHLAFLVARAKSIKVKGPRVSSDKTHGRPSRKRAAMLGLPIGLRSQPSQ